MIHTNQLEIGKTYKTVSYIDNNTYIFTRTRDDVGPSICIEYANYDDCACFADRRDWQPATSDEAQWLASCIEAKKFITKNDAMTIEIF